MDQLMCASLFHTRYWYEVGMLIEQGYLDQPGKVGNPARGQLDRENEHFPVSVRA